MKHAKSILEKVAGLSNALGVDMNPAGKRLALGGRYIMMFLLGTMGAVSGVCANNHGNDSQFLSIWSGRTEVLRVRHVEVKGQSSTTGEVLGGVIGGATGYGITQGRGGSAQGAVNIVAASLGAAFGRAGGMAAERAISGKNMVEVMIRDPRGSIGVVLTPPGENVRNCAPGMEAIIADTSRGPAIIDCINSDPRDSKVSMVDSEIESRRRPTYRR